MGLLSRLRRNDSTEETTSIGTNPTIEELQEFFKLEDISDTKLTSATYYTCMLIRCNSIAKLSLKIKKDKGNEGTELAKDDSLYKLLRYRPNPFMTPHDFIWATEFQRLEYGNAFWVCRTDRRGNAIGLYLLDSTRVTIWYDEGCLLDGKNSVFYQYNDGKKGDIFYTNDEICHFKNFARNGIKGTSVKKYMYDIISNEQYANKVIKNKYKNGLQDPIVVKYVGDLNDAKQQRIKKKFKDLGGARNAGKVIPIPTEFDVSQLETKLVNNQFFQLQGLSTKQIANAFGVKAFQLNDLEKSSYNNLTEQNKAYYSETLQNALTEYEEEVDYKLIPEFKRKEGYYSEFNIETLLRSDIKTRYECYKTAIGSGWQSRKEVRDIEGMPYIEGTEVLTVDNGACIPLKDLGKQYDEGSGGNANK